MLLRDEIDGFANRPLVIPELTTRVRDDVNVCCPRARALIFRRSDRQLYGHRQGRALRNAIIDALAYGSYTLRCRRVKSPDHPCDRSLCDVDFSTCIIPRASIRRVDFKRGRGDMQDSPRSSPCIYKLHFYMHTYIGIYTDATSLNPHAGVCSVLNKDYGSYYHRVKSS